MHKILIAPLDWGLGHATRCIPLIKQLRKLDCEILIACEGAQLKLLQQEFPTLQFLSLRGYRINYANSKRFFALKILFQIPQILKQIKKENLWLGKIIDEYKIDAVISDNRYGLFSEKISCIFITHQLQIAAQFSWLEKMLQKINYKYINRFSECWVADVETGKNIAGKLSHPKKMPSIPVKYIGILSRFEKKNFPEKKYDWLIVLSGPEPQRTLLEKKLLSEIKNLQGNILFVRGKPGSDENISAGNNCTIKNHLATTEMQQAFEESEFIISRSGYTTVMEIISLRKKSILIPTPGQTEQEYLARHLMKQNWCYCFEQDEKNYSKHFDAAKKFKYEFVEFGESTLEKTLRDFLKEV